MAGFDYTALLASDPALQLALAQANTAGQQQRTALTAARRSALIQLGAVPTIADSPLIGGLQADINPETRTLAQEATSSGLSTLGQLNRAFHQREAGTDANLAARGLSRSGLYRQAHLENIHNLQTGEATEQQKTLGALAGAYSDYLGGQSQLASGINSATSDALSRLSGELAAGTIAPPAVTHSVPAGTSSLVAGEPKPHGLASIATATPKPRKTSPYATKPLY